MIRDAIRRYEVVPHDDRIARQKFDDRRVADCKVVEEPLDTVMVGQAPPLVGQLLQARMPFGVLFDEGGQGRQAAADRVRVEAVLLHGKDLHGLARTC